MGSGTGFDVGSAVRGRGEVQVIKDLSVDV